MKILLLILCILPLSSRADPTSYTELNANILTPKCLRCHSATHAQAGIALDSYDAVMQTVVAGSPEESLLMEVVVGGGGTRMPPGPALSTAEIQYIRTWITEGALEN